VYGRATTTGQLVVGGCVTRPRTNVEVRKGDVEEVERHKGSKSIAPHQTLQPGDGVAPRRRIAEHQMYKVDYRLHDLAPWGSCIRRSLRSLSDSDSRSE
jgi:hypothetical protein